MTKTNLPILDQDEQRLNGDTAIRFSACKHPAFNNKERKNFNQLYLALCEKFTVMQFNDSNELSTLYSYLADNLKRNFGQGYPPAEGAFASSLKRFLNYES
jgi:hypothetical protein